MNPFANRAEPVPPQADQLEPLDLNNQLADAEPAFDQEQWAEHQAEQRGAGGRQVLGTSLIILAAAWLAFSAWSAGRSLLGQSLGSPAFAQWVAVTAAPLALLALAWIMFGRTRRREAERFTKSVVTMRTEARSLEALLEVLSHRIHDSRTELTMISQHLMQIGDEATGKLGGITREFDTSSERLKRHGEALDRAANRRATTLPSCLGTCRKPSNPRAPSRNSSARSAPNPLRKHPNLASRSRHSPSKRGRLTKSYRMRPTGWPFASPKSRAPARSPPRASAMLRQHFRDRSTRCSTAHRRASTRSARASMRRRRRLQRSSNKRPRD